LEIERKFVTRPSPPVSGPSRFLTTRTGRRAHDTHHRPDHHTVTALTAESTQALVTAGHHYCPCRGEPYPALWRVPSPFPSSSRSASALPHLWPPLCSMSLATSIHRCHRPNQGTAPPSPLLHVAATVSPSHGPTTPERVVHRVVIFLSPLHRRPPPSEHLGPRHHVQQFHASALFGHIYTFATSDLLSTSPLSCPPPLSSSPSPRRYGELLTVKPPTIGSLGPSFLHDNTLPHLVTGDGRDWPTSRQRGKGERSSCFQLGWPASA
jgi:hypothetical protein